VYVGEDHDAIDSSHRGRVDATWVCRWRLWA
jgi:hypothetical protein